MCYLLIASFNLLILCSGATHRALDVHELANMSRGVAWRMSLESPVRPLQYPTLTAESAWLRGGEVSDTWSMPSPLLNLEIISR